MKINLLAIYGVFPSLLYEHMINKCNAHDAYTANKPRLNLLYFIVLFSILFYHLKIHENLLTNTKSSQFLF